MNNMKFRLPALFLIVVALATGAYQAPAQQAAYPHILTLADAIGIAKTQSPDALIARQTFRKSYWEYRSYKASNLPSLTLTANVPSINQSITPYMQRDSNRIFRVYAKTQSISEDVNLALTQKIGITGGTISINSSLSGNHDKSSPKLDPYLSVPVNIELNQPLFSYNAWRWDRRIKPLSYSLAKRKYLEDCEQISITATEYFFNLLEAQIENKIAMTNLKNYDTLYRIAKGRYQLGKIAENDLLQLELSFLKAQAAVENANLALDNAQFRFKSYLRLQDSLSVVLLPPAEINFAKINPDQAVTLASDNSSTSLDFKKRLLEAASAVNFAKLDGRFDARLHALVGLQQSGATIPDTYVKPQDQRQMSLGVTIPILDWGVARGQIKMAQSQEEIVKNSVEQEVIDFKRNVYLKAVEFNMQQKQLTIAAKSDTVARKSYEVIKGRYLIGKINSILDLNNAQMETDNAEKNYYFALQTYWKSYFQIRKMTLFDFNRNEALRFDLQDVK
ncbi:MAG TPA: TolC family protein [Bacteroidales bacterium]|nr:TolC family protein [Bacteroidales bacterium]HPS62252.1 TolC family protein [Bacteroidales bacterium]